MDVNNGVGIPEGGWVEGCASPGGRSSDRGGQGRGTPGARRPGLRQSRVPSLGTPRGPPARMEEVGFGPLVSRRGARGRRVLSRVWSRPLTARWPQVSGGTHPRPARNRRHLPGRPGVTLLPFLPQSRRPVCSVSTTGFGPWTVTRKAT